MPEQIVDPGPFLSRLATQEFRVEFPDGASLGSADSVAAKPK
jgi:hypothetical protein